MRAGKFPEAAAANLQRLRSTASNKFTIAVGVYCDRDNVARAYQNSGSSDELIILPYTYQGRSCYRVFWGVFDTQAIAERSYSSVPSAIRAPDSIPVPISRLIR
jgi:septal ring-binding cell division protein DamX